VVAWARSPAHASEKAAQRITLEEGKFSARHQSLTAAQQRKRRTLVKLAQSRLEGAALVLREVRMDGARPLRAERRGGYA
jgi:hypothetical protein